MPESALSFGAVGQSGFRIGAFLPTSAQAIPPPVLPVYGEDRWGIFPSTCAIQPGCARRFPKLPHQFSPLANPRCRKLAKLSPGYSAQRIFAPSQSHGGQPAAVQRRDGDVVEREPGTSAGLLKPTRSRRYNVRRVKNPLFEAGEERSRGRGMQAHPPPPALPINARAIPRPQPSIVSRRRDDSIPGGDQPA